jgi:hypothetical protein
MAHRRIPGARISIIIENDLSIHLNRIHKMIRDSGIRISYSEVLRMALRDGVKVLTEVYDKKTA